MSYDPDVHTFTSLPFCAARPPPPSPPLPPPPSPSPAHRPTLASVLSNAAPAPFSLARFARFLHDQHCIEVLAFTQAIASYRASYHAHFPSASTFAHLQPPPHHPHSLWRDLIDTYVSTRAAHQVNLHGRVRENLLAADRDGDGPPPEPGVLGEAEESTLELLGDVFAHFVERASVAVSSCPVTPATSRAASPLSLRRGRWGGWGGWG